MTTRLSAGKKEHGDASKPAVAISEAQSTADQQLGSTSNKPSHSAAVASATAAPFEAPLPHTVPVYTHASTVEGHPTSNGGSSIEAEGRAAGQTQQGQEGGETDSLREGGPGSGLQSHNLVLPLSLLLNGGLPVKKRGRPYKNAATAEKAAQREARRAAHDAAEKAAYQAASEAAQVVIAAPPVKKRRGRPPKDPAKLAAALAAYHANTQARQASVDAERGFAGLDTVMEAAQAAAAQASASAAAAAAAAGQPAAVSAPLVDMGGSAPPPPAQKKRGRPSRSIAKAVGDALQTLSGSLATANGSSNNHFLESFRSADFDGNDDDQALLDAAAVLTSDLPFPQGVREQAEPLEQAMSRQPKGKRKSGAHANAAAQSGTAASHGRRGRRGLELVSSRATALLDSIGPDLHGPGEAAPPPRPHPGLLQRTGAPVGPSNPDPPPPLGFSHPPKRQRRDGHSSQQPATAASGSTENRPQSALTHAPSPPSPRHRTASDAGNDIKHALADDPSAVAMPTATASSPNHPAAEPVPAPDAATGNHLPCSNTNQGWIVIWQLLRRLICIR